MLISRSLGRKLGATAIVAFGFVLMYETKVMDFFDIPRLIQSPSAAEEISIPSQSNHLRFAATAYCKGTTTASGVNVRTGIAAADPDLLPVGSVIQVDKLPDRYNDIYIWNCNEALTLGRRTAVINVLRLGWNPKASTPGLIDRLFRAREAAQAAPLRL